MEDSGEIIPTEGVGRARNARKFRVRFDNLLVEWEETIGSIHLALY